MCTAVEMFSFDPNPTRAKNAWSSSTCLLYALPALACRRIDSTSETAAAELRGDLWWRPHCSAGRLLAVTWPVPACTICEQRCILYIVLCIFLNIFWHSFAYYCLCGLFCIFERCLDLNPEGCPYKQMRYQLATHLPIYCTYIPALPA